LLYGALRRQLALAVGVLMLAGLFEVLTLAERPITTLVVQVPATTHLMPRPLVVPVRTMTRTPTSGPSTTIRTAVAGATAPVRYTGSDAVPPPGRGKAPLPGPPPNEPNPGAPVPPTSGDYRYRYTVDGGSADGVVSVRPEAPSSPGGASETEVEQVGGSRRRRTLDWSSAAVTIRSSDYGTGACAWSPGLLSLSLPFRVGEAWHVDSSCAFSGPGRLAGRLRQVEQVRVDGLARTTVNRRPVEAWVIERHTLVTESVGADSLTTESQSTELFAPRLGLVVYEDGRTASPNADGSTTISASTMELLATPG
jgi:hypothetical protein